MRAWERMRNFNISKEYVGKGLNAYATAILYIFNSYKVMQLEGSYQNLSIQIVKRSRIRKFGYLRILYIRT